MKSGLLTEVKKRFFPVCTALETELERTAILCSQTVDEIKKNKEHIAGILKGAKHEH